MRSVLYQKKAKPVKSAECSKPALSLGWNSTEITCKKPQRGVGGWLLRLDW
jgi:hypothetical protein